LHEFADAQTVPGVVLDEMHRVTACDGRSAARKDCAGGEFDGELADRRAVPTSNLTSTPRLAALR
jgi:hypothetical protein